MPAAIYYRPFFLIRNRRFDTSQRAKESRPTSRAYRTWRPWLVSPSNHPSPMSAGPARLTRLVFGKPCPIDGHETLLHLYYASPNSLIAEEHPRSPTPLGLTSRRRFASSRGTKRSIYDRFAEDLFPKKNPFHFQLLTRQQTTTNDYSRLQTFNQRVGLDKVCIFATQFKHITYG